MEEQERKERLVVLLKELLEQCDGIKGKLAQTLKIKPSTLTPWLQGKMDPARLDVVIFIRLAQIKAVSVDEICLLLGINSQKSQPSLKFKFRNIIKQLLSDRSQQELADLLQISRNAISRWTNPEEDFDPARITIDKIVAIADEKGWTIERLLIYLGLKELVVQESSLFELQSRTISLPLTEQITFLTWLFNFLLEKVKRLDSREPILESKINPLQPNLNTRTVLIILEVENNSLASQYTGNLVLHFQLQPENITIATPRSLPDSLSLFDVFLFDLNNQQSPCIPLIESLDFDGDVVAFVDRSLPQDIQDRLKEKVTEVVAKPVPWSELKDKPYFE
ncbi:MAG: helix-turn-helix transcriptional regulator [Prochloraceae cyanobacterium]|nr:helix-turn-helix transcriptional regulator [Prochloraceae cyanobacterium]